MPADRRARARRRALVGVAVAVLAACSGTPSGAHGAVTITEQPATAAPTGAAPTGSTTTTDAPATTPADGAPWPTYHHDTSRRGYVSEGPRPSHLRVRWRARLDGAVYGSPIVATGRVFAATENNTVYALDPRTGRAGWRRHLGTPVAQSALPCGNIDPLGITGTPAYDPATGDVYVVAELANPLRHEIYALDARTGAVRWHRGIDVSGMHPEVEQQRPALAVHGGRVYVALGGLAGDCGDYHGYVIGVPTSGRGTLAVYRTPSRREAGIWAASGPAVDGAGHVYVSVGNGVSTQPPYDGSDAVIELDPGLRVVSWFAPQRWAEDNAADLDLGSTGPLLLPGGYVLAVGKSATVYLLRAGHLGGLGGSVATLDGCRGFGGSAARGSVAFLPCTSGLWAVQTSGGRLRVLWRASAAVHGSPVVTDRAVWALAPDDGRLYALSQSSGHALASVAVGEVTRFASPSLVGGTILVPTVGGIVAVTGG